MTPTLHRGHDDSVPENGAPVLELDPSELARLSTALSAPRWLRDAGATSWYLVGILGVILGLGWLLGMTGTIVAPLTAALIVAAVCSPLVSTLVGRRMPRAAAAVVVLLALLVIAVLTLVLVIGAVAGQRDEISNQAAAASSKAEGWLTSLGVSAQAASSAKDQADAGVPDALSALAKGVLSGIRGLTSLVFGLSLALLSLFFLLKDGPSMRRWFDGHVGLPVPVAQTISGGVLRSLRGYFRGVTIVAVFNGVVVSLGALVLGVPLAGTIGVVTVVTAYVPYIGAFVAGAFAVVLALGSSGTTTALIMLVIVILANGLLQNVVQPFAMGSALDLHPLVVLVVTIAAGCLLGMTGLILAAPLTSAAVHITRELSAARAAARSPT